MINSVYQTVQAILNKDQLGYLKPMWFNLLAAYAQRKEYNKYFLDLKSNVRKMNWMLDGKNFADLSEHSQQLLEHFSQEKIIISTITDPPNFGLGTDIEFIKDIFYIKTPTAEETATATSQGLPSPQPREYRIEKVDYRDFKDLARNIYAAPSLCNPYCSKVGNSLKVAPNSIEKIIIHYLRKPKAPKWTFEEVSGVAMFNPTASDFQDFDLPETSYDSLIDLISKVAGVALRDGDVANALAQQEQQDLQNQNLD